MIMPRNKFLAFLMMLFLVASVAASPDSDEYAVVLDPIHAESHLRWLARQLSPKCTPLLISKVKHKLIVMAADVSMDGILAHLTGIDWMQIGQLHAYYGRLSAQLEAIQQQTGVLFVEKLGRAKIASDMRAQQSALQTQRASPNWASHFFCADSS
jgi:hypothetical protein